MENKCSKCGGELITGNLATGAHGLGFIPAEDMKKFKPRYSGIICEACVQCGNVENIRVQEPEKIK